MSDIDNGTPATGAPDPIAQLKGETYRKLDNVKSQIDELRAANQLILEQVTKLVTPAPAKATTSDADDLSTLMYSDPAAYAALVRKQAVEEATTRIKSELQQEQAAAARTNNVLASITSEYPELQDADHELTRKAVEIYSKMDPADKSNPLSYKLAVKEAATELNVKPKRQRTEEDFYSPGGATGAFRRPSAKKDKLNPNTEVWASLLGVDTTDPEVKQRLIQRQNRNWITPQEPITTKKKGK